MRLNNLYFLISGCEKWSVFLRWKILIFACFVISGCVTWDLGKVGYMEPSNVSSEPGNKRMAGEECAVIMGDPFFERAVKKAKSEKLKNAVIMLEPQGLGMCYRIYVDKDDDKGEQKK